MIKAASDLCWAPAYYENPAHPYWLHQIIIDTSN